MNDHDEWRIDEALANPHPETPPETRPAEPDLFRFEVPSARGKFVIIGPEDLTTAEADDFIAKLTRILTAMFR